MVLTVAIPNKQINDEKKARTKPSLKRYIGDDIKCVKIIKLEIRRRIHLPCAAFGKLSVIFEVNNITIHLKRKHATGSFGPETIAITNKARNH